MQRDSSTTERQDKARQVFGDVVCEESDVSGSSLNYSPSPKQIPFEGTRPSKETGMAVVLFEDEKVNSSADKKSSSFHEAANTSEESKENVSLRTTITSEEDRSFEENCFTTNQSLKNTNGSHAKSTKDAKQPSRAPLASIMDNTERAVFQASLSVNKSLKAVKKSKDTANEARKLEAARLRQQRKEEKEEAAKFHALAEKSRLEALTLQRQLSSKFAKERAGRERDNIANNRKLLEQESMFNSNVFRDHQLKRKEAEDKRRRESIEVRAKIRADNRKGKQMLKLMCIEEDKALLEERHAASQALQQSKKEMSDRRRESLAFRNIQARQQRELEAKKEEKNIQCEHESYELKWAGEKDAELYRKRLIDERRESLAFRNEESKKHREDAEKQRLALQQDEHESHELERLAAKDAEAYQEYLKQQRRNSLAFRNTEGKKQRDLEKQQKKEQMEKEHESYELVFEAERDVRAYKENEAAQRRESLALRNQEKAKHEKLLTELRQIALEKQAEDYALKWAGEDDGKAYLKKLAEQRRKSLQARGQEAKRHREKMEQIRQERVQEAHAEEALRSACQKDVEAYRKECEQRDRSSLAFQRKEARVQRLEEETRRYAQLEKDAVMNELEALARADVERYLKDCKERRRLSLVGRAKEQRRHANFEKTQQELRREEYSRQARDRAMDSRYVELARKKERWNLAVDALRHAGCTFSSIPK